MEKFKEYIIKYKIFGILGILILALVVLTCTGKREPEPRQVSGNTDDGRAVPMGQPCRTTRY